MPRSPRRYLLFATWLLAYLASVSAVSSTCSTTMTASLGVVRASGTSYTCCSSTTQTCLQVDDSADCPAESPLVPQCILTVGARACGIALPDKVLPGSPCGAYSGTTGGFGAVVSVGLGAARLSWNVVNNSVIGNWPNLGYNDALSLCCSPPPSICHLATVTNFTASPCNAGEFQLKCAGGELQGLCSVWSAGTDNEELGEFLTVNADPSAPPAALPVDAATTTAKASMTSAPTSDTKGGLPDWAIACIIAVVAIVAFNIGFWTWHFARRRSRRRRDGQFMRASAEDFRQLGAEADPLLLPTTGPLPLPDAPTPSGPSRMSTIVTESTAGPSSSQPSTSYVSQDSKRGPRPAEAVEVWPAPPYAP